MVGVFGLNKNSLAAVYYVSPNGVAAWGSCTVAETPCPVSTALTNAVAGDTVNFVNGEYRIVDPGGIDYHIPMWNPAHSGTESSPITFKSLNKLGAHLIGIAKADGSAVNMIGSYLRQYIVWDGFLLTAIDNAETSPSRPFARFGDGPNDFGGGAIQNCTFIGAPHGLGGALNIQAIFFERYDGLLIHSNIIYGYSEATNNQNTGAISSYKSSGVTISNNEIHSSTIGIHLKDDIDDSILKNNFLYDNYIDIYISNTNPNGSCERDIVENNIFTRSSYTAISVPDNSGTYYGNDLIVRNNTFYNTNKGFAIGIVEAGHGAKIYNNVFSGLPINTLAWSGIGHGFSEMDHNELGSSFNIRAHSDGANIIYSTLLGWQTSEQLYGGINPSDNLATGATFVSGSPTEIADFALTSESSGFGAGRGGVNMGADVFLVGVQFIDTVAPSRPSGLVVE